MGVPTSCGGEIGRREERKKEDGAFSGPFFSPTPSSEQRGFPDSKRRKFYRVRV